MSDNENNITNNSDKEAVEKVKFSLKIKESYKTEINPSVISNTLFSNNLFSKEKGDEVILFELPKDFNFQSFKDAKLKSITADKRRKIGNKYIADFSDSLREISNKVILNNFKDSINNKPTFLEIDKLVKVFELYEKIESNNVSNISNNVDFKNIIPRRFVSNTNNKIKVNSNSTLIKEEKDDKINRSNIKLNGHAKHK